MAKRQGILRSMFYINGFMSFYDFIFSIRFLCTIKDFLISYILLSSYLEYVGFSQVNSEDLLKTLLAITVKMKSNFKVPWHLACGFVLFWIILFFAVVIPLFYRLPTALTMEDAKKNEFIAERAYKNLYTLSNIGSKTVGSRENEIEAVEFLLKELNQVKEESLKDLFDIEIDLTSSSGVFERNGAISAYQALQNIAVKLTPKGSTSKSYLLVNSHFDTLPAAGAGDAGFMIVTMLEVFRVMAKTNQSIEHPIVFLFNGAEESGLQASHAFITQHKWAPFCK